MTPDVSRGVAGAPENDVPPPVSDLPAWLVAGAGALAMIVVLYPGQYTFDSAYQVWEARTGQFVGGSPVAMIAVWSLLIEVSANPATLFCLNVAMLWSGLALCVIAITGNGLARAALLLAFGLTPLAMVEMAHVLTDAHLAAVLALATGFAAWGMTSGKRPPLVACVAALAYAACVRHNALIAIVPYGALLAVILVPAARRGWLVALAGAIAVSILASAAVVGLDRALVGKRVTVWPTIALWDLAAISVDRNALLVPSFAHGPGLTVDELAETGAFDPTGNTSLFQKSRSGMRDGIIVPFTREELRALRDAWIAAVLQYPGAYARHRLRTFWLLIASHRGAYHGVAYFVSRIDYLDNPPLPAVLSQPLNDAFYELAADLTPTWVFAALPYLLISVLAGILGIVRREWPASHLALAISSSALLYAACFLPLAPAADLRYLTWPIVAGPVALAFALASRATGHHPTRS